MLHRDGKAVVPILTVLTVLAMVIAGAAIWLQIQEREKRLAKEHELLQVIAELDGVKTQLVQVRDAKEQVEGSLARTRQELESSQLELAKAAEEREALSRAMSEREAKLAQFEQELTQLRDERESLAHRINQFSTQQASLQQQLDALRKTKDDLETKVRELTERPTVELDKIVVGGAPAESAPPGAAAPTIAEPTGKRNGQVININRKYDFIIVNLGKNHGLSVGQEFQVLRGEEVLGRVKVEKVYDELSAATILPSSRKDTIREGDTVEAL